MAALRGIFPTISHNFPLTSSIFPALSRYKNRKTRDKNGHGLAQNVQGEGNGQVGAVF